MAKSKANRLRYQGDVAVAALEAALVAQRRFGERAVELCEQLELDMAVQSSAPTGVEGMNQLELRDWLCAGIHAAGVKWAPRLIGTSGSGPWHIDDFDAFLASMGFELAHLPNEELKCIILGDEGWDEDALSEQVYDRDGSDLLVLSQPLFVAGLLKNINPLEGFDRDGLLAIAEAHGALSFLMNRGFDWLFETTSDAVTEWVPDQELAEMSPLRLAGYSVAASGPGEAARREVLESFFFDKSPKGLETSADRKRWGSARSAQRLYGMATFIAWLCRFQGAHSAQAEARWRSDLEWLKREFFRPTMRFAWPAETQQDRGRGQHRGGGDPRRPMFTLGPPAPPAAAQPATPQPAKTTLSPAASWPFPTGNKN